MINTQIPNAHPINKFHDEKQSIKSKSQALVNTNIEHYQNKHIKTKLKLDFHLKHTSDRAIQVAMPLNHN